MLKINYDYSLKLIFIVYICSRKTIYDMKEITKAQEEILRVLWEIHEGVVADVIAKLPDPKPAYNTVSTVIKVLEKKGYVSHKVYGKTFVYFPKVTKEAYAQYTFNNSYMQLFNGSLNQVVSFFVKEDKVSLKELEELKNYLEAEIEKQKK
jgi:BlaI family transcriptional regulator, penicillinase repressor